MYIRVCTTISYIYISYILITFIFIYIYMCIYKDAQVAIRFIFYVTHPVSISDMHTQIWTRISCQSGTVVGFAYALNFMQCRCISTCRHYQECGHLKSLALIINKRSSELCHCQRLSASPKLWPFPMLFSGHNFILKATKLGKDKRVSPQADETQDVSLLAEGNVDFSIHCEAFNISEFKGSDTNDFSFSFIAGSICATSSDTTDFMLNFRDVFRARLKARSPARRFCWV